MLIVILEAVTYSVLDERIWQAIVNMPHSPSNASGRMVCRKRTRLIIASKRGDLDVMKRLLDVGANIVAKCSNDISPLAYASMSGNVEVLCLLLDRG